MADVGGDEYLFPLAARYEEFPVGQRAGREDRVNVHGVLTRPQCGERVVREAKTPGPRVVAGPVWNQRRLVWERVQVAAERMQIEIPVARLAVTHDMQIATNRIRDNARWPGQHRPAQAPFIWNTPVKYRAAGAYLMPGEAALTSQDVERGPGPVSGNAPTQRVKLGQQISYPGFADRRLGGCVLGHDCYDSGC